MEDSVVRILEARGPLTGAELREALGSEGFGLWRACMRSDRLAVERVGCRYLRLDKKVEGYARLSPSILREFLTYCVIGLASDLEALEKKRAQLASHIAGVSAAKIKLAQRIVTEVGEKLGQTESGGTQLYCILLGGDIVYGMGHDAPRSERSTGQMVKGSDVDLVVITEDDAPGELARVLDGIIYRAKYRHLNNPVFREEIDYVVKPLERVREQVAFDTFKRMVACKILNEAVLIYGSQVLYDVVKDLLVERGIADKLADLETVAIEARKNAERRLLEMEETGFVDDELYLFHTSEETEEFE